MPLTTPEAILIAAIMATAGWVYTIRRHRIIARKQHTFNALLTASFSQDYNKSIQILSPYLRMRTKIKIGKDQDEEVVSCLRFLLNHYEFLAAAVRIGDIDEKLLKRTERGLILSAIISGENYIYNQRDGPTRKAVYEHLDWLYRRWTSEPPGLIQLIFEGFWGNPWRGRLEHIEER